jgi:hypothetical protein
LSCIHAFIVLCICSLFIDEKKLTGDVRNHLKTGQNSSITVTLKPYESIRAELESLVKQIKPATKAWVSIDYNHFSCFQLHFSLTGDTINQSCPLQHHS